MADNLDPKLIAQALNESIKLREEAQKNRDIIKDQVSFLKESKTLQGEILSLTKKLYEVQRDIDELDREDLGTSKDILNLDKQILKAKIAQKQLEKDINILGKVNTKNANDVAVTIQEQIDANKENLKILEAQKNISKSIRDNFGVKGFGLLSEIFTKFGGKGSIIAEPFKKASDSAKEMVNSGFLQNQKIKERQNILEKIKKGELTASKANLEGIEVISKKGKTLYGDAAKQALMAGTATVKNIGTPVSKISMAMQGLTAGAKSLGSSLGSFLKGPIWITALVEAAKFFVNAMFDADKQVTDIAKNFVISKDAAREVRNRFFELSDRAKIYAGLQENQILLQKELVDANIQLNNLLGTAIDYSSQLGERGRYIVSQFAAINKFLKLSEEEQTGLLNIQQTSSKSINEIRNSVLGTTSIYKIQTGVLINERKVLESVLKASNAIKLTTKGSVEELTKAAFEAQKLGLSLQKVSDISKGFLDFEQSISSELEAELLTGRNLNLETARLAALNGDLLTVAKEITNQIGSSANFSRMNVIQQEALAKSVNMTREELADILVTQERLNTLRGKFNALGKDQIEQLKETGALDENILNRISLGKGTIVDYYNALKEAGKSNKEISNLLADQAYASLASRSAQEKFNESLEKAKETFTRFVDGGSLDKLANFITKLVNFFSSEKTSTLTFSEKKAIKEDTIIPAGKEFAKGGIVTSRIDNATIGEAGPEAVIPLNQLMGEFKEMRQILTAILNKEGTITLNGTKMGTAMAVGSYKVQ